MDYARLEELKTDLLNGDIMKHRHLLIGTGLALIAFWAVTLVGGYYVVTHALDDNHVSTQRSVNTPSQVGLLLADHRPSQLINSIVFLNRVKLKPSETSNVYYAGEDEGQKLVVVSHASGTPIDDSVVNVMGTVRPVSAELLKKWKLTKDEQKAVKAEGIYIDAESVKKVQHATATVAKK